MRYNAPVPAFIYLADNALDRETCDQWIERFGRDGARQPGQVGDGVEPGLKRSTDLGISRLAGWRDACERLDSITWPHVLRYAGRFPHLVVGGVLPKIQAPDGSKPITVDGRTYVQLNSASQRKIAQSVLTIGEWNLQRYDKGQGGYPHWHCEIYPRVGDTRALHRLLFVLVYLNDVSAGGHTEFAYQKRRVEPSAGRLVMAPAGFTHTHRGTVPKSGDKYVATSWIVFRNRDR
ncbi:MAG: 2OG-Fe(II) oxygenase [Myxococcales bacterium FL481]|nr:MAG: 2OG-Fe(II) oxygenase [Myxococcales bacterium FL481]